MVFTTEILMYIRKEDIRLIEVTRGSQSERSSSLCSAIHECWLGRSLPVRRKGQEKSFKKRRKKHKKRMPSSRPSLGSVDRLLATAPPLLGISLPTIFQGPKVRCTRWDSNPKPPVSEQLSNRNEKVSVETYSLANQTVRNKKLGSADGSSLQYWDIYALLGTWVGDECCLV